mgnify:CR=1 FL=1
MKTKPVLNPRRARKFEMRPEARRLRQMGLSFAEVGKTLHISCQTAWNWAKDVPRGDIFANDKQ